MIVPQEDLEVNSQKEMDSPDETAAVLSFATNLSQQLMPKAPQTQEIGYASDLKQKEDIYSVKEEKAPEIDLKANNEEMGKVMDSKLDELRKEIKDTIKEELSTIKESIEEALSEDD